MKKCTKCGKEKLLTEFNKKAESPDGHRTDCKTCSKAYDKEYCLKNKEKIRNYYIENKETIRAWQKEYGEKNIETLKKYRTKYYSNYTGLRRKRDLNYKIRQNLANRLYCALKGRDKSKTTMDLLGCTIKELRLRLESMFTEGMTWENYGSWHIDHIQPCASFNLTDPKQQKICFHYTNLQPLWAKDNLVKHSKVIF